MDRRSWRYDYLAIAALLAAVILAAPGCRTLATAVAYMTGGTDLPPDYAGLKGKKVVVVCRTPASLQYASPAVAKELAQQVGALLQERVPKIHVVDQQEVADWCDRNTWEEYPAVGKAMKAEMVVGIDLSSFSTLEGQTLYRGKANTAVKVYDLKPKNKLVWKKSLPQAVYPPNLSIPTSERQEVEFRQEFIAVLADQVARHFYKHDPHADIGLDSRAGLK